ncbi:MAG: hypothetical protein MUO72_19460 [Bacteroidales bacterium]|nr:hypothetical protein [Bacteroidales bacterium]
MSSIGQIDGETTVFPSGSIRFSYPGGLLLGQGLDGIKPGIGPGSFIQFFSGNFGFCSGVSRESEMVSIHTSAPLSEEIDLRLIQPLKAYPIIDERLRQLDQWYQEMLEKISPGLDRVLREQIRTDLERIYQHAALGEAPVSSQHDLVLSMSEAGFFSLMDFNLECFRDLVAMGLPGTNQVLPTHSAILTVYGEKVGLPLFEEVENNLITCF